MTQSNMAAFRASAQLLELEPGEVDEAFDLLRHSRRRYLLEALTTDTEFPLEDLVEAVAERERKARGLDVNTKRHDQVRFALFHSHLPRLEETGVICCDHDDGAVTVEDAEKLERLEQIRSEFAVTDE